MSESYRSSNPSIKGLIDRFRKAPPMPRDERDRLRLSSQNTEAWWNAVVHEPDPMFADALLSSSTDARHTPSAALRSASSDERAGQSAQTIPLPSTAAVAMGRPPLDPSRPQARWEAVKEVSPMTKDRAVPATAKDDENAPPLQPPALVMPISQTATPVRASPSRTAESAEATIDSIFAHVARLLPPAAPKFGTITHSNGGSGVAAASSLGRPHAGRGGGAASVAATPPPPRASEVAADLERALTPFRRYYRVGEYEPIPVAAPVPAPAEVAMAAVTTHTDIGDAPKPLASGTVDAVLSKPIGDADEVPDVSTSTAIVVVTDDAVVDATVTVPPAAPLPTATSPEEYPSMTEALAAISKNLKQSLYTFASNLTPVCTDPEVRLLLRQHAHPFSTVDELRQSITLVRKQLAAELAVPSHTVDVHGTAAAFMLPHPDMAPFRGSEEEEELDSLITELKSLAALESRMRLQAYGSEDSTPVARSDTGAEAGVPGAPQPTKSSHVGMVAGVETMRSSAPAALLNDLRALASMRRSWTLTTLQQRKREQLRANVMPQSVVGTHVPINGGGGTATASGASEASSTRTAQLPAPELPSPNDNVPRAPRLQLSLEPPVTLQGTRERPSGIRELLRQHSHSRSNEVLRVTANESSEATGQQHLVVESLPPLAPTIAAPTTSVVPESLQLQMSSVREGEVEAGTDTKSQSGFSADSLGLRQPVSLGPEEGGEQPGAEGKVAVGDNQTLSGQEGSSKTNPPFPSSFIPLTAFLPPFQPYQGQGATSSTSEVDAVLSASMSMSLPSAHPQPPYTTTTPLLAYTSAPLPSPLQHAPRGVPEYSQPAVSAAYRMAPKPMPMPVSQFSYPLAPRASTEFALDRFQPGGGMMYPLEYPGSPMTGPTAALPQERQPPQGVYLDSYPPLRPAHSFYMQQAGLKPRQAQHQAEAAPTAPPFRSALPVDYPGGPLGAQHAVSSPYVLMDSMPPRPLHYATATSTNTIAAQLGATNTVAAPSAATSRPGGERQRESGTRSTVAYTMDALLSMHQELVAASQSARSHHDTLEDDGLLGASDASPQSAGSDNLHQHHHLPQALLDSAVSAQARARETLRRVSALKAQSHQHTQSAATLSNTFSWPQQRSQQVSPSPGSSPGSADDDYVDFSGPK